MNTTTDGHTDHSAEQHQPSPTTSSPRPGQPAPTSDPTTGSATTASTKPAPFPCDEAAACTTSPSAAHKRIAVILLIDDLDIRVIATDAGELLRAFELNPNIGYQPRFKTKKPPEPGVREVPMS